MNSACESSLVTLFPCWEQIDFYTSIGYADVKNRESVPEKWARGRVSFTVFIFALYTLVQFRHRKNELNS